MSDNQAIHVTWGNWGDWPEDAGEYWMAVQGEDAVYRVQLDCGAWDFGDYPEEIGWVEAEDAGIFCFAPVIRPEPPESCRKPKSGATYGATK